MLVMDQGTWKWNWIFGNLPGCKPWMQGFLFIYLSNFLTYLDHGRNGIFFQLNWKMRESVSAVCVEKMVDGWEGHSPSLIKPLFSMPIYRPQPKYMRFFKVSLHLQKIIIGEKGFSNLSLKLGIYCTHF